MLLSSNQSNAHERKPMFATELAPKYLWSSMQEPICESSYSNTYLRLLSALDSGWQICSSSLQPSWDQNGFVYQVIIKQSFTCNTEEIILPMNSIIDEILKRYEIIH